MGYDGGQKVRDEERSVGRKPKPGWKPWTPPPVVSEQEEQCDERPPRWKRLWGWTEFGNKSLWNWLELLIVPIVLSLITVAFTWQQDARQQRIENQRAEAERELVVQRAQDEALQAYLDQMNNLLLEHNLRNSKEDSGVRTLARARTLTVLGRLDGDRKGSVVQFLYEAGLLTKGQVDVDLAGADLREVNLIIGADLSGVDLSGPDLTRADLIGANLSDAYLYDAYLFRADLRFANLRRANLRVAHLFRADLRGADLSDAILSDADLRGADLGADLSEANLSGAEGITNEELEQQAYSLEGATMPNGQKYEDWIKSKSGRKDGENSRPS